MTTFIFHHGSFHAAWNWRKVIPLFEPRMREDSPCDRVFSLTTGHSPFFSQPAELVDVLMESLGSFGARS